ncbi:hypothetical protein [Chelativorans sp. M5D2P16]|uniref:hypothetical protein n=1 Tax=Chelativorans sp. M5D2P16 TaxID=3095678 RepID=UPI002ACADC2A|nr:hypothetical protein [Chelativorans sp. M5D2P16]MDZ5699042.1 hypothetical protein [Chelativorans sp. M5D2P16]
MADDEKRREDGGSGPGPAYPARYVRLGRVNLARPSRRAILSAGALLLLALLLLAILAS